MSCKLEVDVGSAVLPCRPAAPEQESVTVGRAELLVLYSAAPWRTFRWFRGQRHYSGWYWVAAERDLVIHESPLETSHLNDGGLPQICSPCRRYLASHELPRGWLS